MMDTFAEKKDES